MKSFTVSATFMVNIDQDSPTGSVCDLLFVKDTQNLSMAKVIVSVPLAKFGVQFEQAEGKHDPKTNMFNAKMRK